MEGSHKIKEATAPEVPVERRQRVTVRPGDGVEVEIAVGLRVDLLDRVRRGKSGRLPPRHEDVGILRSFQGRRPVPRHVGLLRLLPAEPRLRYHSRQRRCDRHSLPQRSSFLSHRFLLRHYGARGREQVTDGCRRGGVNNNNRQPGRHECSQRLRRRKAAHVVGARVPRSGEHHTRHSLRRRHRP